MRRDVWAAWVLVFFAASGVAAGDSSAGLGEPLRLGVVGFYNPRLMYLKYQPLVDYLTEHTGRPWELAISTTYEETVKRLCADEVAVAYLGPLTYVRAHAACGVEPVVCLKTRNRDTYDSHVMVRQDSEIRALEDLRGKRFGFGAPLSASSHLVPRAMLEEAGISVEGEVDCRYYWHHERAARAVLLGEVEACGVRDIVGEKFAERGLRVLAVSAPIPNFPLVMAPGGSQKLKTSLERVLVDLPREDPSIKEIMKDWDEEIRDGFAPCSDAEFESPRRLASQVFGSIPLTAPEVDLQCESRDR
jgi:phosphonate transport system substrate-binding protein